MCTWQVINLRPNRANGCGITSIKTFAFVQHHVAHGFVLYVVEIALCKTCICCKPLFVFTFQVLVQYCFEGSRTLVFRQTAFRDFIYFVVSHLHDFYSNFFVVRFVAVLAFYLCLLNLRSHVQLRLNLYFDSIVSELDGVHHFLFRNFFHLTFYHNHRVHRGADHHIHFQICNLSRGRVDDVLAVNATHTNLRDRTVEWKVTYCNSSRCRQTSQRGCLYVFVVGNHLDHELDLSVVILWEQRTQYAVDQTHGQYFVI